jgi:hypothetical protein
MLLSLNTPVHAYMRQCTALLIAQRYLTQSHRYSALHCSKIRVSTMLEPRCSALRLLVFDRLRSADLQHTPFSHDHHAIDHLSDIRLDALCACSACRRSHWRCPICSS